LRRGIRAPERRREAIVDIGPPRRIIEIEPVNLPVPETIPEPAQVPQPAQVPEPAER